MASRPEAGCLYDESDLPALANFVDARALSLDQIRGALNEAFSSRESAHTLAFSPTAVGDAHDMDSQALRTLLARLELRGVVQLSRRPTTTTSSRSGLEGSAVAKALGSDDGQLWRSLWAAARPGRVWVHLSVTEAARLAV